MQMQSARPAAAAAPAPLFVPFSCRGLSPNVTLVAAAGEEAGRYRVDFGLGAQYMYRCRADCNNVSIDNVAERLRRCTRNALGSARVVESHRCRFFVCVGCFCVCVVGCFVCVCVGVVCLCVLGVFCVCLCVLCVLCVLGVFCVC